MFRINSENKIDKTLIDEIIKNNSIKEIVIFSKEIYTFEYFANCISYFELGTFLVNKLNLTKDLKNYFMKLFSILSYLKPLQLEQDIIDNFDKMDYKQYSNKVKIISNQIDKMLNKDEIIFENEFKDDDLKIYSIKEIENIEELSSLEKDNSIVYINTPKYIELHYSQKFIEKYNDYFGFVVSDNKYMELFNCFIDTIIFLKLSKNCLEYDCPFTRTYVHINIVYTFNLVIESFIRLRNCYSFKSNCLYYFDKIELDNNIKMINFYLKDI